MRRYLLYGSNASTTSGLYPGKSQDPASLSVQAASTAACADRARCFAWRPACTGAQNGTATVGLGSLLHFRVIPPHQRSVVKALTQVNVINTCFAESAGVSCVPASIIGSKGHGFEDFRREREWRTVSSMIQLYCRGKHRSESGLCDECSELMNYASLRLERCVFGEGKPTCANCPVHCYQRARREQIKAVMRYAGPRMLWRHPVLALRHWRDGFRRVSLPKRGG